MRSRDETSCWRYQPKLVGMCPNSHSHSHWIVFLYGVFLISLPHILTSRIHSSLLIVPLFCDSVQSDRGHELTYSVAGTDPSLKLSKFGAFFYDNLVLMAPRSLDLGDGLSVENIQSFINSGRSVFIAVNNDVSEIMREIVTELGLDIDETGTVAQDHGAYDMLDSQHMHDVVIGEVAPHATRIAGKSEKNAPITFRGIGHVAQTGMTNWISVLTGSSTAYSYGLNTVVTDYPAATGRDVRLVSALQTVGNGRIVFAGSIDMLNNEFFYRPVQSSIAGSSVTRSSNGDFVRSISMWCFQERGLLRARDMRHHKVGSTNDMNPSSYRVSDDIHFGITIEEYDGESHDWKPYLADDVQLEFIMIDPYIRSLLSHDANGRYSIDFRVPDVYGVYKFVIPYQRIGLGKMDFTHTVSIRPFRHDEFERFIGVAYPYYTGAFSMMAAFFVFGIVFLYHKEK